MIDDDPFFLEVAPLLLRDLACVIETAAGPREGLESMAAERPDVLILDFSMPQINGFELIEVLRCDPELSRIPKILISGSGRLGQLRELLVWDTSALLGKPVRREELVRAVEKALGAKLAPGRATIVSRDGLGLT